MAEKKQSHTPKDANELDNLEAVLAPDRNFMHLDAAHSAYTTARVVVVPVPFDLSTTYRPGTREGPHAIIDSSRNLDLYDPDLGYSPYEVGIHTLRAVDIITGNAERMVQRIEHVTGELLDRGKFVVTFGGDHMISVGTVRAFAARYPQLTVLQIDAHADLRDEYEGSPLSSATIMRRVLDICPRTAQVGIRSMSEPEAALIAERKLPLWRAAEIHAQTVRGRRDWIEEVVAALTDEVYITFDIDAFDPSLVPGTGTPEPGGLGWYDAVDLLAAVTRARRVVGFDLVELSPLVEGHVSPVVAAKLAYKLIGLALHPAAKGQ